MGSGVIRVGVIGCGRIAERHLNAYRKLQDVELVVSDIVEHGRDVAERHGARWDPSPSHVLRSTEIDAIDVCTPTPTHAEFIADALESGKHVFCEKPLARSVDEALAIQAQAERSGKVVMVGYLYRFHPAFELVREVLDQGIIGDPYLGMFRLGARGSHRAWKHRIETGGGAGNEALVHMLDLAVWYFGEPRSVTPLYVDTILGRREIEGRPVEVDAEDIVLVKLDMDRGLRVICQADLITPGYMNHVEIQGTNGSIFASILDTMPTSVYCIESRGIYERGHNQRVFPRVDLFERELAHFLATVRGEPVAPVRSLLDSVRLMRIMASTRGVPAQ